MEAKTQEVTRRRFTVHEYHRMAEAGILHEDDRVELIEGEVSEMAPIGARHASVVRNLNRLLGKQVGGEFLVDVQNPVRLDEGNEPKPDLAVIRMRDYRESLPSPEDVLLLIEVPDTTLSYDRNIKLPLYARSGISEVWISQAKPSSATPVRPVRSTATSNGSGGEKPSPHPYCLS